MTATHVSTAQQQKALRGRFVARLLKLGGYEWNATSKSWTRREGRADLGSLAELRSGLGKEPGRMARVHKHVVPWLPEARYEDRWYYIVATLFGLFPVHQTGRSLGAAFRELREESDSMDARFTALLNAHADDLDGHLRHTISLLKTNEQPLDWFRLLDDLAEWDHPEGRVQLTWARHFYASPSRGGGYMSEFDSTQESKEIEDHE